jgi:hypothetical protein
VEKKTLLKAIIISVILFSAVAGTQLVNLGRANPIHNIWISEGDVAPDSKTKPPTISILSPESNNVYSTDNISLSLKVRIGDSVTAYYRVLSEIYLETDWQTKKIYFYNSSWSSLRPSSSEVINLTGIPDGNHTIMVYAVESGRYLTHRGPPGSGLNLISYAYYYVNFNITGCALVRFTVDTTPPRVRVLSLQNKTYSPSDLPLNFEVDMAVSQITYSLDGQGNVTISGNTTLTNLSYGVHDVTIYATDEAGNTGASETIIFSIAEPFPTTLVIAPIASVTVLGVSLVVYRKRKRLCP